ncbi:1,4-alpha-glucan-branching enzyme [Parasponia andersonii]|uniref:1,4-alpha-glucan-branching enzyme n=1 Tax=Parasponia andersonii TaxID=3476 RepID=A0A2P5A8P8_PARAD|nr:1,4-alpha-glucan-branching enzyme [Parasponia andersonii]
MASKTSSILLFSLLHVFLNLRFSVAQTAVKGSYWYSGTEFPVSNINSCLFTHLFCAFAGLDPTTYGVTISHSDSTQFSTFTRTVQQKNPSVKTLLSIGGGGANTTVFAAMASQQSRRKSFIDSRSRQRVPDLRSSNYYTLNLPVQKISNSLDWINVMSYDFYGPGWSPNFTAPPAALYNATVSQVNAAAGIRDWIRAGFPANKIVLGLPFYGYAWRLVNANNNGLFAPATGAAVSTNGDLGYNQIRSFISSNTAPTVFNATVVTDYCYSGTTWIGYDDVSSVTAKVGYAKGKGLLGYFAWNVGADYNWTLSQTAFRTWGA